MASWSGQRARRFASSFERRNDLPAGRLTPHRARGREPGRAPDLHQSGSGRREWPLGSLETRRQRQPGYRVAPTAMNERFRIGMAHRLTSSTAGSCRRSSWLGTPSEGVPRAGRFVPCPTTQSPTQEYRQKRVRAWAAEDRNGDSVVVLPTPNIRQQRPRPSWHPPACWPTGPAWS
jgi:hypothetical protein